MSAEPREFGPYRLIRRLGVGGMAETFEASRLGSGDFEQRVCLKRILPAFCDDEELLSRFRGEARLAARLRHTNIVGVIDAGEIEGAHYMTLELVDGVDLRSLLRSSPRGCLAPPTVVQIALDLAYALDYAHGALVHRDISPSNILLSRSGEAKLADFGIAKPIGNGRATTSRSARGKIPYMAPEQMRGEVVDGRADLFSLGVVMFESLSGERPFDGAHDVETMQRILEGTRRPLDEVAPGTPRALQRIVERLLEVDRDARPRNAAELVEELAEVAPPPAVRRTLAETVESHRGGPEARFHVRAREERDTELTQVPPGNRGNRRRPAPEPSMAQRKGRRALVVGASVLASLVALALAGLLRQASPPARIGSPSADTDTNPSAAAIPDAVPSTGVGAGAREDGAAARDAKPIARKPVDHGWVRVVVEPWGNVWIDGRFLGRAPVRAKLRKGRHVIEGGRELPWQKRVVRVQPGARKLVELSLAEP